MTLCKVSICQKKELVKNTLEVNYYCVIKSFIDIRIYVLMKCVIIVLFAFLEYAVETGSFFEVLPLASSTAHHISYESMIVIGSMSVSGLMLLFSLAAISYVIHKRKQYRAKAASASAVSTKSEYSLRTVAEQLDNDHRVGRSLPRINNRGSNYSLRKDNIDYGILHDARLDRARITILSMTTNLVKIALFAISQMTMISHLTQRSL